MSNMTSSRPGKATFVEIEIGQSSVKRIDIGKSICYLGKGSASDMRIDEQNIADNHAQIWLEDGRLMLTGLSIRDTWVNGVPLIIGQPFPLIVGDRINLGSERTVLMVGGEADSLGQMLMLHPKPEMEIDEAKRAVYRNGIPMGSLSRLEFDVLIKMYNERERVITFDQIFDIMPHLDNDDPTEELKLKRIRQTISSIRRQVERQRGTPVLVRNKRDVGYLMPKFRFLEMPPFSVDSEP